MKLVVTGGAGFIGSHIVEEGVRRGFDVTVIDNLHTGKLAFLEPVLDKIHVIGGDIRDASLLDAEFKDADFVSHHAALRSVPESVKNPQAYNDVNVQGHYNVLEAARKHDVKCVTFAASSSAYGNSEDLPSKETHLPRPISPYAVTKVLGENYCRMFHELYGLKAVSLRYFNVFGPRQDPASQYAAAIAIFIRKMLAGEPPLVFGDGLQTRDFTYVQNNVEANFLAFGAKTRIGGEVINICNGKNVVLNDLLGQLNGILRTNITPTYTVPRPGDVKHTLGDGKKAQDLLDYKEAVSFEEGLKRTVEWFREGPRRGL